MHEFVKPLSPNKCITIGMYFSATNKATTDKTLKVKKRIDLSRERLCGKRTVPRNKNIADLQTILTEQ